MSLGGRVREEELVALTVPSLTGAGPLVLADDSCSCPRNAFGGLAANRLVLLDDLEEMCCSPCATCRQSP